TVIYRGQQFVIKDCEPQATGAVLTKQVTANHVMFTCQDWRQDNQDTKTWSIGDALHWAFDGNDLGFTFETIGSFPTVQMENFGDANALDLLNKVLSSFGGVVDAGNKHIIVYSAAEWGSETNKQIRYQYNTDNVQCTIDTTGLKTIIKGYGAQNEDGSYVFDPVTYTSPNADKYGPRRADPVRDERFTNVEAMQAYLPTQLQDNPIVSLTTPLKRVEDVQKGEHWLLIYEPMQLDLDSQIVAYSKYPYSPGKPPDVTWSNATKDMVSIMSNLSSATSTVNKVINSDGTIKDSALGTTVSDTLQKINGVVTADGDLDLSKAVGRLDDSQVSVGPQTSFADGYDPVRRLTDLSRTGLQTLRTWLWGQGSGGGPNDNTEQSDSNGIYFNPRVNSPYYDSSGSLKYDKVETITNAILSIRQALFALQHIGNATSGTPGYMSAQDKKLIDVLADWVSSDSVLPQVFDPLIVDPHGGSKTNLSDVLEALEQRLADLEEGGTA
ncbi:MAG: hypothetical protein K0R55_3220, partial [Sporomusa sp.]|nr:hypothetical protein [Sporomusa sp.]